MSNFLCPGPHIPWFSPYLPLFFHILPHSAQVLHMVSAAVVDWIPYQNLVFSWLSMPISSREDGPCSTAPDLSEPIDKWFYLGFTTSRSRLSTEEGVHTNLTNWTVLCRPGEFWLC